MHLHSGAASGLRPCLCGTSGTPEGSPNRRRGGGGGPDTKGGVSFAGVLFLQFGEETRRVHITHEVSSLDTLHALIAHMFPQKLTMGMLKSPNTAILIKDRRNLPLPLPKSRPRVFKCRPRTQHHHGAPGPLEWVKARLVLIANF